MKTEKRTLELRLDGVLIVHLTFPKDVNVEQAFKRVSEEMSTMHFGPELILKCHQCGNILPLSQVQNIRD